MEFPDVGFKGGEKRENRRYSIEKKYKLEEKLEKKSQEKKGK